MMKPLELAPLSQTQVHELDTFYRTTKDVRLRTRAQLILLAAEQKMSAPTIAALVRETDQPVRNWLKRYEAEGIEGLNNFGIIVKGGDSCEPYASPRLSE